ncbi:hypothetical protein NPIL_151851 [Nephila pilipes]|uniref:Uncharacterized protein n=1 Tax=Nephila pilipes TaxID=299642 RepID=A0A8X6P467_NEPPI|nr:hypothetical protein NPIL_151851 [Nephila pilipes]
MNSVTLSGRTHSCGSVNLTTSSRQKKHWSTDIGMSLSASKIRWHLLYRGVLGRLPFVHDSPHKKSSRISSFNGFGSMDTDTIICIRWSFLMNFALI